MGKRKIDYIVGGVLGGVLGACLSQIWPYLEKEGKTIGFYPALIGISAVAVIAVIALIVWRSKQK